MSTNVLYGETERRVYPLSMIYDPDTDLPSTLESEAKIIPAVSSLVVDDETGLHNTVYVVVAVNEETLKSTLRPAAFAEINDETVDRILSYGNNIYMLYYSDVIVTDDTNTQVKCTRLSIDDKFTLFGNHSANYQLVRTNADGTKSTISQTTVDAISVNNAGVSLANGTFKRYNNTAEGSARIWIRKGKNIKLAYDTDSKYWYIKNESTNITYYTAADEAGTSDPWTLTNWTAKSTSYGTIPTLSHVVSPDGVYGGIAETVAGSGIRKCISCYSYASFEDGEQITINVYDAAGILLASAQLITKKALILEDISDDSNPIVKFDVSANQMIDGEIFLYRNQDVSELALYPKITYANGEQEIVSVGDGFGYVYGKEEIDTQYVGVEYPIVVKYYIPIDTQTTIAEGADNTRFLTCTKNVKIIDATENTFSKLSVIPVFDSSTNVWKLSITGYKSKRNGRVLLTNKATITGFNGTSEYFKKQQIIDVTTQQTLTGGSVENFSQTVYIEVRNPTVYTATVTESMIGKTIIVSGNSIVLTTDNIDTYKGTSQTFAGYTNAFVIDSTQAEDSVPYGSETLPHIAPFIQYNSTKNAYWIPSDVFVANSYQTTAKEVFLENFYYTAKPPFDLSESSAADNPPTHFTVRMPDQDTPLLTEPIAVENFSTYMQFNGYTDKQMVGNTVVVEFWRLVNGTTDQYEILYGVPVYVRDEE